VLNEIPSDVLLTATDAATDFVILTDATAPSCGGPFITYANARFLTETQYKVDDVLGKSPTMFFGRATDTNVTLAIRTAIEEQRTASARLVIYRRDGSAFWAEFNGSTVPGEHNDIRGWIAIGRNITERKRDEDQLAMLSAAVDNTSDQIAIYAINAVGRRAPRLVFVNAAMLAHTGFSRAELFAGRTGVGPETDMRVVERVTAALRKGVPIRERMRLYRKDGSAYWGELAGHPVLDPSGRATHWITVERNIDDAVHQELALAELSRMQNDLIAMLAHDVKGPLTVIAGYAQLLRESLPATEDALKALDIIDETAERLTRLADETLSISSIESSEFQIEKTSFDLGELLQRVVDERSARHPISLSYPKGAAPITADREKLYQTFDNIVNNAIKYSKSAATVEVKLSRLGGIYQIVVTDHGIGIPRKEIDYIFGRFARGSNAKAQGVPGTGFGLYLVKTIVELHGGTVRAESKEGAWTSITVQLPITLGT
jgi:PAS domain S-box-containing protein